MTQQPFSRPGAIDLGALKRPAQPAAGGAPGGVPGSALGSGQAGGVTGGTPATGGSAYSVELSRDNFQTTLEASMTAPVLLMFYSATRMPESATMAHDLRQLSDEFEGRFLVGLVDIDAAPEIAQAMQIPSIPLLVGVIDGRPQPLLQDIVPIEELRTMLTQVSQQLTVSGLSGRHQPRRAEVGEGEEEALDPRYAAAQEALGEGDIDRAVAEYQKLVDANPADSEAAAGLAMAKVLQRTRGVDLNAARAAAAADPDDVDAQTLCADLDLLGGHVEDAFNRLVGLVARSAGDERNKAREHLIGLFGAVGNEDPRVLKGRQALASALF
ncbi:tetratricopeptide repeat protein [Nocardioides sp. BP30]|uniref:co-chaperone YbbN n=1 Tax=Nocardioides sp. BP30 TaxID=3036374 RepID=UPI002468ECE3|nr:tetratricopeptide repeat protein [Nocardioides sp. BP30]WGL51209.1 tetratricopeptide repeat protein [Nocardioides sp. BP30]